MKYKLNKLPVKTTNGFQINDVVIDLDIPEFCMNNSFQIEGDVSQLIIQQGLENHNYSSKIGLSFPNYYSLSIVVPKNVIVSESIVIEYSLEKNDALFDYIKIEYEENSSCNFVIKYHSADSKNHFHHCLECVHAGENAIGKIVVVNLLNPNDQSFYAVENDAADHSSISHTIIDVGGKTRLYNVYSEVGSGAKNYLDTIYLGKEHELLDFQYYLKNLGMESENHMRVEGALMDSAHKNFRGTIDFIKGCSHSIGEEKENCILLSENCLSRSLPQLLCGEEDVVGNHGVSSGEIPSDQLFYLMSRGFSKRDAEKLIVLANFHNILHDVPSTELQDFLLQQLENKLS